MRGLLGRIFSKRPGCPDPHRIYYTPRADGRPEPGEVCWAWVPFEEDASQGKDRPVLIIGTRGHRWLDVGAGQWDRDHRASELRLDRLLVLSQVPREGSALDRSTFDRVITAAGLSTRPKVTFRRAETDPSTGRK